MYVPLYEKRGEIVSGIHEPTEEECEWESEDEEGLGNELKTKVKIEDVSAEKKDEYVSGSLLISRSFSFVRTLYVFD